MSAEHSRPLAAFVLVALACALVVGQAVRTAAVQQLVNAGLPLNVLVRIAPEMLFTVDLSSSNGRAGDVPYVGRAVVAVARVTPAPASAPAVSAGSEIATAPDSTVARVVLRATATAALPAATRHRSPARHATVSQPTAVPAASTSGRGKHERHHGKATNEHAAAEVHHGKSAAHQALKAAEHRARHAARALLHQAKHAAEHHGGPHAKHHSEHHPTSSHHANKHH